MRRSTFVVLTALLFAAISREARAETISFGGIVTTYRDLGSDALGIPDATGEPIAITFSVPSHFSSGMGGFNARALTPLTIGSYDIEFTNNQWSENTRAGGESLYLAPYDPVSINGASSPVRARAESSFVANLSGTLSWQIGLVQFDACCGPVNLSLSGTGHVLPVPEPTPASLICLGLLAIGLVSALRHARVHGIPVEPKIRKTW